jgi:hypothetical protein
MQESQHQLQAKSPDFMAQANSVDLVGIGFDLHKLGDERIL